VPVWLRPPLHGARDDPGDVPLLWRRAGVVVVLEKASQEFVEGDHQAPLVYELSPDEARAVLDDVQAAPIGKLPVEDRWITVPAEVSDVRVRIVRPQRAARTLPAMVFVEYDRSPEAHYPVAIEQGYAAARWVVREGAANQLDPDRMAIAGDSAGGGMTAALTLMAADRRDVRFVHQSMYYPVTDAAMDTGSYE
jgi:acetyl esterase/lipase